MIFLPITVNALSIITLMVQKNLTHIFQPLDITMNYKINKMELLYDPEKDLTTIKVDLRMSTLKPKHLETLNKIYEILKFKH